MTYGMMKAVKKPAAEPVAAAAAGDAAALPNVYRNVL